MTGPEFLAYVKETFKRDDKDDEIYSACTDALQFLLQGYSFDDYKKTTQTLQVDAGTNSFDLPSDFLQQISDLQCLDTDNAWPMTKMDREAFLDKHSYLEADNGNTDGPIDYCIFGGKVYVAPYPDDTYNFILDYEFQLEDSISASTATVPFSQVNRRLLKEMTLSYLYGDLEMFDLQAQHQGNANTQLNVFLDVEMNNAEGDNTMLYNDF